MTCASPKPARQNITVTTTDTAPTANLKSLDILTFPPPAILSGEKLGSKSYTLDGGGWYPSDILPNPSLITEPAKTADMIFRFSMGVCGGMISGAWAEKEAIETRLNERIFSRLKSEDMIKIANYFSQLINF